MNHPDIDTYKQDLAVFRIRDLNAPWREILDRGERKILPRHHELSNADESTFFFLNRGTLHLSCIAEDGQERVVMIMEEGVLFGEITFMHKSSVHFHSLRTLTECEIIVFPNTLLDDLAFCREYPHLVLNLVKSLGVKGGAFFSQIYDSNLLDARGQICRMLSHIWREQGEKETVNPDLSQVDMANILGIHRSSVCRVIHELRDEGVIGRFSKTRLEVLAPIKLMEHGKILCLLAPE
ncbi:Crp/Fnr family transcriptional regulator [Desulfoluna spongiiphila]|uniref:cAMP-binding domain of CRP or a regulatory subunit of cAMP-dependent protein kinases n=1 Tax=Desulfoluna spongiiphila TaxID=419481 RepID=A0A1G5CTX3_9BACT|nr:Crp/Fnr family transcriptional regulator [Desulfoluna spongiiphila]SCY06009.1 cAMP-binding domain of CRP or a regulatory subunit of cAMP-dependent protein kinases [Desulfoluna spongiiphila]VVS92415.1 crp-type hth domain [Desulfoluna spongiiphila]